MVTADWAPLGAHEELIPSQPEAVYGDLLAEISAADLAITNLECVLGDAGEPILKAGPNMRYDAAALVGLTAVPFHVATLANNHVFDYGAEGFAATLGMLREAGIQTVGAGLSEAQAVAPLVVPVGRTRVALVNFCEGEDGTAARGGPGTFGWQVARVVETVRSVGSEADVVVVICHGGREHPPFPPPYIVQAYRRIADAGADIVIGHHPHAPQGMEIHRGTPIIYSMGNFVFLQRADLFFRRSGYMVEVELSAKKLSGLRLVPYLITPEGLHLMAGDLRQWFLGRLREVSAPLSDASALVAAWEAFIDLRQEQGFEGILKWVLAGWGDSAPLAAARLRNVFQTPAHFELWTRGLTRIAEGRDGTAPEWAQRIVRLWTTLSLADGMTCPQ
jgi:hypothetical protein